MLFGLVHNWPGARNSEFDIIHRIIKVLGDLGHQAVVIDPSGAVLDEDSNHAAGSEFTAPECDVVLNFHYLNPKFLPGLSYVVNWNPVEYIVDDPITRKPVPEVHLRYIADCLRSHDRVLSAGSSKLDGFVAALRAGREPEVLDPRELCLHTTMPAGSAGIETPRLPEKLKVFYIGSNWERLSDSGDRMVRHEGLLEALDESGRFEFYGVKEQGGVPLWDGIRCYRGELPFDGGESIVQASRNCGVSLVLSSDQHRASELVSTRIFQACAAGTIIISDRNRFIERHFSDSVLFFDYGENARESAGNILAQLAWIDENRAAAEAKAQKARAIFLERFSLERQVEGVCQVAAADLETMSRAVAACADIRVRVHMLVREEDRGELSRLLENVSRQSLTGVEVFLYASDGLKARVEEMLGALTGTGPTDPQVLVLDPLTTGECMARAAGQDAQYHLWHSHGFDWNRDHLANLVLAARAGGHAVVYAPYFGDFPELRGQQDTSRYFLTGLQGGFRKISVENIEGYCLFDMPLGNVLLDDRFLAECVEASPALRMFDIGALALTIQHALDEPERWSVGMTCAITSKFTGTQTGNYYAHFDEYLQLPGSGSTVKVRDQRLGRMLRDCTSAVVQAWDTRVSAVELGAAADEAEAGSAPPGLARRLADSLVETFPFLPGVKRRLIELLSFGRKGE